MKRIRPMLVLLVSLALACTGATFAFADSESSARSAQSEAVADGNTASTWRDWGLENSTENVGRIWTDKTVQAGDITLTGAGGDKVISKGNSTFLTALSAISSTSNVTSKTDVPLDIVLVLDASGSMNDPMGKGDSTQRINALKEAANSFVDEIAKQNASVSDATKQHQVSIVKFAGNKTDNVGNGEYQEGEYWYNFSQVMKTMAVCTDASKSQFKDTINSISPSGSTRSDFGMELAQSQTSNRDDAKKVVIFFTDGKPASYSDYDPEVAKGAVDVANAMKGADTSVYTIGIFDGADPAADVNGGRTSDENKFMQAVSSNYPKATYTGSGKRPSAYTWSFGDRAQNSDFYKSATNADELKKVFEDISQEIVKGAGYPTDTKEGFEADSGFITFTDQLGDYMQVDAFTSIVFANQVFENPTKTTNGLVDTYTFTGEAGTVLYPSGNLKDIDITVTRSNDLKTGDKVEVKIPAALIPLRHFEVNEDGTGSVDLTFPIRVFYGSSLKGGVVEALANPDSGLASYIAGNSADGKVSFLANKWNGGPDGDVLANFTPSKGNSYYYITEDTPIYQDEACTQRAAAPLEEGETYYYQRTWYDIANGNATQQTRTVSFDSGVVENIDGYISRDTDGEAYFKAGTPRMTYINELNTVKGSDASRASSNITETASTFINPKWAGDQVNTLLGNNGKLSVSQPGTLAVTKELQLPAGYSAADFANDSFEFSITIPAAANTTLKAQVKNTAGETVGDAFDISFDENGNAAHSLKNGETLYVYGLAAGAEYTVSETAKAGFTQVAPVDQAGEAVAAEGTIEAGKTANAAFTNAYSASTVDWAPIGEKEYTDTTGTNPLKEDMFHVAVYTDDVEALLPAGSGYLEEGGKTWRGAVTSVEAGGGIAFPQISYGFEDLQGEIKKTYTYKIAEVVKVDDSWVAVKDALDNPNFNPAGMEYDTTVWTALVTIKDVDGVLELSVSYTSDAANLEGASASQFSFSNSYNPAPATATIEGSKTLAGRDMAEGETFGFTLSVADKATQDAVAAGSVTLPASTTASVSGGKNGEAKSFSFDGVSFSKPGTYTFNVSETQWDGSALPEDGTDGLTFDRNTKTVTVVVSDGHDGSLKAELTHPEGGVAFTNQYRATDVSFDTANAQLKKVLEGRDWLDSDSFTFSLKALTDGAPMPEGVTDGAATTTVTKENAANFSFGSITFTADMMQGTTSKTFEYEVSEVAGSIAHIDYATNKATIKVTVVDDGTGRLTASASTENGTFTNRYAASVSYTANGGIELAKTLNGRDMADGQFKVAVTPADEASANALGLAVGSNEFALPAGADGQKVTKQILNGGVTFTQSDAGKTYTYTAAEVNDGAAGYTYDSTAYTVTIAVTISDVGKLTVTTTVSGGESAGTYVYTSDSAEPNPVTLAFTNSYKAEGNAAIGGTKALTGRDLVAGEFSFAVRYAAGGEDLLGAKNGADGSIDFGTLSYSTESLAKLVEEGKATKSQDGTWVVSYVAYEKTDGLAASGVTAQTQPIPFTVTVADNGDGTLTATPNVGSGLKFANAYGAEAVDVQLSGVKVLERDEGLEPGDIAGKFTFTVTSDDADAPMPASKTAKNAVDGSVDFGAITFTLDDLNKAWEKQHPATQSVGEESAAGQTVAAESAAAANEAKPIEKAANSDAGDIAKANQSNSSAGKASEPAIQAGAPRSVTFTYKITESGSIAGVANDSQATKTVTFKVADDGKGKLTVTRVEPAGDATPAFTFVNTYSVDPASSSVTDQIKVTKQLTGRDLVAGEFHFELLEDGGVVAQGTNDAAGNVLLDPVTYEKPGTHNYTLREVGAGTQQAGVTYDGATFSVTTTVKDNGDGTLGVTHKLNGDIEATFNNAYESAATSVTLGATKVLKGKGLEAGEFTFVLAGDDGSKTTAKNDANGNVTFGELEFSKPGTYHYTVSEEKGSEAGVTYDETTYPVIVTVTDDGQGNLTAAVSYEQGAVPVFTNRYQEPESPLSFIAGGGSNTDSGSAAAKTGDGTLALAVVIATVAALAAGVAVVTRRKGSVRSPESFIRYRNR